MKTEVQIEMVGEDVEFFLDMSRENFKDVRRLIEALGMKKDEDPSDIMSDEWSTTLGSLTIRIIV